MLGWRATPTTHADPAGGDTGHDQRSEDPSEEAHEHIMPEQSDIADSKTSLAPPVTADQSRSSCGFTMARMTGIRPTGPSVLADMTMLLPLDDDRRNRSIVR